jgi:hypothetical protein
MAMKLTVEKLIDELATAYNVLEYALPLALRQLKCGGSLLEQAEFWHSIHLLESFIDVFDDLDNLTNPFDDGIGSMLKRAQKLMDLQLGGSDEQPASEEAS